MKKLNGSLVVVLVLAASSSWAQIIKPNDSESGYPSAFSESVEKDFDPVKKVFKSWHDRVEIGTRIISIDLKDDSTDLDETGNGFLGSIVGLDGEDDLAPTRFFIDILATPYLGLELSYDKISAETQTSPLVGEVKSDGTLELSGPIVSIFGRYPNKTGITPYGGIGYAFYSADFSETGHWANGYPDPSAYAAAGSPNEPLGGRSRKMNVDDVTALVIYGGVIWSFHEHWAVDLYVRSMDAEVDANFVGSVRGTVETDKDGKFPMEHTGYGLSVHYLF